MHSKVMKNHQQKNNFKYKQSPYNKSIKLLKIIKILQKYWSVAFQNA